MAIATRDQLTQRDAGNPLAGYRDLFELPQDVIYLDGNSLGPLPMAVKARVAAVIENQWGRDLVKSWNLHDWVNLPRKVGDKIARLIGAEAGEVIAADSTSVNLFKLLSGALPLRLRRRSRHRLRLQVSQWRSRRTRLPVRRQASSVGDSARAVGLVRSRSALRFRARIRAGQ